MLSVVLAAAGGFATGAASVVLVLAQVYGGTVFGVLQNLMRMWSHSRTIRCAPDDPSVACKQDKTWLPEALWLTQHRKQCQKRRDQCQLVFLGDSITEGWLVTGFEVWNAQFAEAFNAINLGIGGDEVQHVLWRVQDGALNEINPKVLVLLAGTNNVGNSGHSPSQIAAGIHRLLQEITMQLPKCRVLLLGVFPRDEFPGTAHRLAIQELNAHISGFKNDKRVFFLDLGAELLQENGQISAHVMPDFLHLSPEGYKIWATGMHDALMTMMHDGQ